jgi:tetratricopeptide (TPR) repeat protein
MLDGKCRFLMILMCLVVFTGWVGNAAAHRRAGLPLIRPASLPASQPPAAPEEKTSGPLSLKPDSYWQRLIAQEQAGELGEAWKTGLALVNLFPQAPQRGAALLKLAALAQGQGKTEQALELYGLTASLNPGTPEAAQACLAASVLELSQDLSHNDPLQALRHFLEKVTVLPSGYAPESLQEALKTGWQAVSHKVQASSPPSLTLVEEILALWDLQPQGFGPPEAASFLANLLKENGLLEEAQFLLAKAGHKSKGNRQGMLKGSCLELAWLFRSWPRVADTLKQVSGGEEGKKFLLRAWLARRQAGVDSSTTPGNDLLDWFLPQKANAAWLDLPVTSLEQALQHPWSPLSADQLQAELAQRYWVESQLSQAAQMHQLMVNKPLGQNLSPFYQDRLGLSRLKEGQPDAAQATFQQLAQHNDSFWRRLAQVRLADLELSRVQAEPSP